MKLKKEAYFYGVGGRNNSDDGNGGALGNVDAAITDETCSRDVEGDGPLRAPDFQRRFP